MIPNGCRGARHLRAGDPIPGRPPERRARAGVRNSADAAQLDRLRTLASATSAGQRAPRWSFSPSRPKDAIAAEDYGATRQNTKPGHGPGREPCSNHAEGVSSKYRASGAHLMQPAVDIPAHVSCTAHRCGRARSGPHAAPAGSGLLPARPNVALNSIPLIPTGSNTCRGAASADGYSSVSVADIRDGRRQRDR